MRRYLFIVLLLPFLSCQNSGVEVSSENVISIKAVLIDSTENLYKLVSTTPHSFPTKYGYNRQNVEPLSDKEKLKVIEDLLSFEGDLRICSERSVSYNPKYAAGAYPEWTNQYSLQMEALFLINILCLKEPFEYSPTPILFNSSTGEYSSVKGDDIAEAYKRYRVWFEELKEVDLGSISDSTPLQDSEVRWVR